MANSVTKYMTRSPDAQKVRDDCVYVLKHSYNMLGHGPVMANARVLSNYQSTGALKEGAMTVKCLFHLPNRDCQSKLETVDVLCLGLEAVALYNMLKAMWGNRSDMPSLVLAKCSHPSRTARESGTNGTVLDSLSASRMLAKCVKPAMDYITVCNKHRVAYSIMSGDAIVNAETLRLKANRSVIKSQGKAAKALSAVIAKMSNMPDIGERMSTLAEALDSFCAV